MKHRVAVKEKEIELVPVGQCHHFWVIEEANGPKSPGVCKYCGQTKDFYNAIPDLSALKRNGRGNPLHLPEIPKVDASKSGKS